MKTPRRFFTSSAVLFMAVACGLPARAEVSAETDAFGQYVRTTIFYRTTAKNPRIWSASRNNPYYHPLNKQGDLNGDLWPAVGENPADARHPWVVWSRSRGRGYDLAWSRWTATGWKPLAWVEDTSSAGDDLQPSLAFDRQGRSYIAWWRDEGGKGHVYLSIFLESHWTRPYLVSKAGIDSRRPYIEVTTDNSIRVTFDTPSGRFSRVVAFSLPLTITDDIDPFGQMPGPPPDDSASGGLTP